MFSTQPGGFPGVVPNALIYSCSLVRLDEGNKMLFSHLYINLINFIESELDFLFHFPYKVVHHENLRVSARVYNVKGGAIFSKIRIFFVQHMGLREPHAYGLHP